MAAPERPSRPHAVLFACGMNSVRSPMAAALMRQMLGANVYVGSAGVQKGDLDPFAVAAMVEYWPTVDPTGTEGSREQRLNAYREVRDQLTARIRERFGRPGGGNE
jgi:protein-tyrosine-phosphatase